MKVTVTIEAEYVNPNPPDIYDPSGQELREAIERVIEKNAEALLWLDTEKRTGLFQRDSFRSVRSRVTAGTWWGRLTGRDR